MKNNSRIISSGPFKGKKIEFAPTTGIDMFRAISEDFMNKVFCLEIEEYLISDVPLVCPFWEMTFGIMGNPNLKTNGGLTLRR